MDHLPQKQAQSGLGMGGSGGRGARFVERNAFWVNVMMCLYLLAIPDSSPLNPVALQRIEPSGISVRDIPSGHVPPWSSYELRAAVTCDLQPGWQTTWRGQCMDVSGPLLATAYRSCRKASELSSSVAIPWHLRESPAEKGVGSKPGTHLVIQIKTTPALLDVFGPLDLTAVLHGQAACWEL